MRKGGPKLGAVIRRQYEIQNTMNSPISLSPLGAALQACASSDASPSAQS
jgi:hypothetical protein